MKPKERTREEALKFLAEGSRQEIFNEAWAGLQYQNFEMCIDSTGRTNHCLYSDGKGHHCAIGWINPYPGTLSAVCSDSFWSPVYLNASYKNTPNYWFLTSLQDAHDAAKLVNVDCRRYIVKTNLIRLAHDYNLRVPG